MQGVLKRDWKRGGYQSKEKRSVNLLHQKNGVPISSSTGGKREDHSVRPARRKLKGPYGGNQ